MFKELNDMAKAEKVDLKKKQGVPKGVDPVKHERCVKDVKRQGKGYNPYAVCSASMKKSKVELEEIKKALFPKNSQPIEVAKMPEKTKSEVFWRIKDNIRMLKDLKELKWTVQEDAPDAKKPFENEYKRLQSEITKLTKEYSSLKKSFEGEIMKKSREELIEEYTTKVKSGEMTIEDVSKALKAGYDSVDPESYDSKVEDIEVGKQSTDSQQVADASEKGDNELDEGKFAEGLFQPVALGSTLRQGSTGNVMSNIKKPAMDYQEAYKNSIKQVIVKKPS